MSKLVKLKTSMAGVNESYAPGDLMLVSDEAAAAWVAADIAELHIETPQKVTEFEVPDDIGELKHLGGGYFELPNGEKIRGKDKAQEALDALKVAEAANAQEAQEAGDPNGAEAGDDTGDGAGKSSGDEGVSEG